MSETFHAYPPQSLGDQLRRIPVDHARDFPCDSTNAQSLRVAIIRLKPTGARFTSRVLKLDGVIRVWRTA